MRILAATIFFLFLHETTAAMEHCSTDFCSRSFIRIHYPFHLQGGGQSPSCGSPGFNLSCSAQGDPVLWLPNSGDFIVRDISYGKQNIVLYDPGNCMPGMVLKLNLTGSPFYDGSMSYDNYTFFDCPRNETLSYTYSNDIVYCLSNATNTVVATTSILDVNHLSNYTSCKLKGIYRLQIWRRSYYSYRQTTVSDISRDLQLSWYAPDIKLTGAGDTSIFKLIGFTLGVPVAICAISVGFCIGCANREDDTQRSNTETAQHNNIAIVPLPEPNHVLPIGLDESTIQSYEKVVVGESRRLSGPNHIVCSICLSEYLPKDILRCIPECKHCFHADCVDEWLRMNRSCPICRKSHAPSPAHGHL